MKGGRRLKDILKDLPENLTILGGNLGTLPYRTGDFLKDEYYLAENAAITAHCALKRILAQFPGSPAVRTLSPFGGKGQHKDHRNLGQAALNLYRQGEIRDLKLFIEPYCVQDCNAEYPELALSSIRADEKELAKIRKAV